MANYDLRPNEVVVLKETGIKHGGTFASYTDELMLTNLNLVLLKKGVFGNSKGVLTFPTDQIKVYNGKAQALLGKSSNGTPHLEVYFLNGQENFDFQSGGKKKIFEWVTKIGEVVTGEQASETIVTGLAIPGADYIAGALKDTLDVFKGRFGSKPKIERIAGKCSACGAPISGTRGQLSTCEYCQTAQQL
ncbi:hypothetical protein [Cryobacterium melibiosiphilum]|nr:hypothetical protein [Cryobacterium melibiosiphilum]